LVFVFAQTIPGCGGVSALVDATSFDSSRFVFEVDADRSFDDGVAAVLSEMLAAAAGAGATAAEPPSKVIIGVSLLILRLDNPAFERSAAEEYGRLAITFGAYLAPTPGRASISDSLAVFHVYLIGGICRR
jgi:hypothetical protein